ncbi:MAG: hypothetical protein ABEK29_07845, partial [Bradymonadaceae bacterium]
RKNEPHAELLTEVIEIGYEQRADIDDKSDIRRGIDGETIDERQYVQAAELDPIAIVEGTGEDDLERSTVDRRPFSDFSMDASSRRQSPAGVEDVLVQRQVSTRGSPTPPPPTRGDRFVDETCVGGQARQIAPEI